MSISRVIDVSDSDFKRTKWRNIAVLSVAELLAMTLWFSASAVVPQMTELWQLGAAGKSWVTISVQLGFVVGALASGVFNISDRISGKLLFGLCALAGAVINSIIAIPGIGFGMVLFLRFLTGVVLAGVYPPGMKLVATWCKFDRGLGIGILVGALTLGTAGPHLAAGLSLFGSGGIPDWRIVVLASSAQAALGGLIILTIFKPGPNISSTAPFNWRFTGRLFTDKPTRLANLGYLGHMWELFAMWTWVPLLLMESYSLAGYGEQTARLSGFLVIAVGGAGCVLAGKLADSYGRTAITIASLAISGACALVAGQLVSLPITLTAVCLVWGFTVVSDSAQYSAAVSELVDQRYIGTALTIQTCVGFLLTMISIEIIPRLVEVMGWRYAIPLLAIGPVGGIWSMARLRALPESLKMAGGRR